MNVAKSDLPLAIVLFLFHSIAESQYRIPCYLQNYKNLPYGLNFFCSQIVLSKTFETCDKDVLLDRIEHEYLFFCFNLVVIVAFYF